MSTATLRDTLTGALVGAVLLGGAALYRSLTEGGGVSPIGLVGFTAVLGGVVGALTGPLVGAAVRGRRDRSG